MIASSDHQSSVSDSVDKTELSEFLSMMDIVDIKRRQSKAIDEQLSFDDQKKEIKDQLRKTYEEMGVSVPDRQLDKAVEAHFSSRWEFEPPRGPHKLATAYINRGKIAKTGAVLTTGLAIIGTIGLIGNAAKNAALRSQEQAVELRVEEAYQGTKVLLSDSENVLLSKFASDLPRSELEQLQSYVESSRNTLAQTTPFFDTYSPNGEADDTVTLDNYEEVDSKLEATQGTIIQAESALKGAKTLLRNQEQFILLGNSLENLISQVRGSEAPDVLKDRGEQLYKDGTSGIQNRLIDEAQSKKSDLAQLNSDIGGFVTASRDVERLYGSIKNVVKESSAKDKGDRLYQEALGFISTANTTNLKSNVQQLKDLDTVLNQEYKITVVVRRGIKTGVWRHPNSNPRAKNHYLVVEAIGPSGNALPINITNEENGRTQTVTMWAEKVPEAVYQRVGKDKTDNGLLDNPGNKYFAEKEKGYTSVEMLMKGTSGRPLNRRGQITKW